MDTPTQLPSLPTNSTERETNAPPSCAVATGSEIWRQQYQCEWVQHCWKSGDVCECEIHQGYWVQCEIIAYEESKPGHYRARYFGHTGKEKVGLIPSSCLRPLPNVEVRHGGANDGKL